MRPLALILLSLSMSFGDAHAETIVRVPERGRHALEDYARRDIDILGRDADGSWILRLRPGDASWLAERGTRFQSLDAEAFKLDFEAELAGYHSFDEMQARFAEWSLQYESILRVGELGRSVEGRPLILLEISDAPGVDEGEPEALILGCLHARELMAAELPFLFAQYLLERYASDSRVREYVDTRRIFVAPVMNPDGRVFVEENHVGGSGGWWRKNRRDNGDGTFGVDLNRNFSYRWGHDDVGSRPISGALTYRGPAPFSEPETQALRDFCAQRAIRLAISYHSFGNLLLYPWGFEYADSEDHEMFVRLGQRLVANSGYLAGNPRSGAIYLTNGGSDDWAYAETDKTPFPMFTLEVGLLADGAFAPPDSRIPVFFDRLLETNLRLLEYADEPKRVLGPEPPALDPTPRWESPSVGLRWEDTTQLASNVAVRWEIEELREPELLEVDHVTFDQPAWELDGFGIVNQGLGNTPGYRALGANPGLQTMTLRMPYRVHTATRSFRCRMRWDVEGGFDYVYLQASVDGVRWDNVRGNVTTDDDPNGSNRGNGITGSSGAPWQIAEFDLRPYEGQTIQLRFAYSTDGQNLGGGVWIDDLGPTPTAAERRTLSSELAEISIPLSQGGRFAYRVRGIDAEGDAGRWSGLLELRADPAIDFIQIPIARSAVQSLAPNPMNPSTAIVYEIAGGAAKPVQLQLFDARGRLVRELVDADRLGGRYGLQFDGRSSDGQPLANGVYHLVLRVEGETADRRKLTVLK